MKTMGTIMKIIGAVATVAAIVFVVVRYGDKIVAWTKQMLAKLGFSCCQEATIFEAEEEVCVAEGAVVAEEKDFEG